MNIKEIYNDLTNRNLVLSDFNDILNLKNQCILEMNQEYVYLADILIIDLYINEGLYDDALNIANKAISSVDSFVFRKIYISLLERLIYIFIQKKNFKSAYRYAFMKKNYLDLENIDEVNRWYLEMAYIYAELNQKDKALLNLKAILSNYPEESLKALTLSNMTKLYIDQEQIEDAKTTLNDCLSLVYKLNDEEGILYCNYLNAKLYILEKNYKHAKQSFQDVFKNINTFTDDYLGIANEYVSLLIEMDLYDEAQRTAIRYIKNIEKSNDLEIKKEFYTNYLKIQILKNKNHRFDVRKLLTTIEVLQNEIDKKDDLIINESNEDDKRIEVESEVNKLIKKIEKTITITSITIEHESIRNSLMSFSQQLEKHISFDEATYVIFPIDAFEAITEISDNYHKIYTYNYKKDRLYERDITYNNLKGSIVEMLIAQNHEIMLDFSESYFDIKDLITEESYSRSGFRSIFAIPLFNKNELYGAAIYLSKTNLLTTSEAMTNLKLATKLLEPKLINIFYTENIRTLKTINNIITNNLDGGVYYYNPENKIITFSNGLESFYKTKTRKLSLTEYQDFIKESDQIIVNKILSKIENVEEFNFEYRVKIAEAEYLIKHSGYPYISREGILEFYYGIIGVIKDAIEIENEIYKRLTATDFTNDFQEIVENSKELDYKCNFIKFRVNNINDYPLFSQLKIYEYVYSKIQKELSLRTYYLEDNNSIAIIDDLNLSEIEKKTKTLLKDLNKGLVVEDKLIYFDVKAALVRFPLDTYNLHEVKDFADLSLNSPEDFQIFNDKIRKLYIKKKSITACVTEHLLANDLELLYQPLLMNNEISGYMIKYNIKGLDNPDLIDKYLDEKIYRDFEKLVFKTLLNQMQDTLKNKIYLKLSLASLEEMFEENYFSNSNINKYRNIVIYIDDYNSNFNLIFNKLTRFEFSLIIGLNTFSSINLSTFINNKYIRGVYLTEKLKNEQEYIKLFEFLNYEIISNNPVLDYTKNKTVSSEVKKFLDIFDS